MKLPTNETELRLYAIGYVDGNVHGYSAIEEWKANDYWYQRGYDAGVADFSYDTYPQGETK